MKKAGAYHDYMKKDSEYERKQQEKQQLLKQAEEFQNQVNRPFYWKNASFFRIHHLKPLPDDHVISFMVILDEPLPREMVDQLLEQAFGGKKRE